MKTMDTMDTMDTTDTTDTLQTADCIRMADFPVNVTFEVLIEKLLLEDEDDIALMREKHEQAIQIAKPKAIVRAVDVQGIDGDIVTIGGAVFESAVLARNLADVHRVYAYVVTCGREVDDWSHKETDPIVGLWLDMLKEMILRDARAQFVQRLKTMYGLTKTSGMSPGSGNLDVWPIAQQRPLFTLLGDVEGEIGVRLTDSFLMLPTKTVSGVLFHAEVDFITCALCDRAHCPNRRAAYDAAKADAMRGKA